jgi:hypothetical protein
LLKQFLLFNRQVELLVQFQCTPRISLEV